MSEHSLQVLRGIHNIVRLGVLVAGFTMGILLSETAYVKFGPVVILGTAMYGLVNILIEQRRLNRW